MLRTSIFNGLLAVSFYMCLTHAHGQVLDSSVTVTLVAETSLFHVIAEVEQQTGLSFSYNPKKVQIEVPVNISVKSMPLLRVLSELSRLTDYSFALLEKQIIIKPKKTEVENSSRNFTFSGTVTDASNGEFLIGTTLLVEGLQMGSVANAYGFFSITLPGGAYKIRISYIGYKVKVIALDLYADAHITIEMFEDTPILPELVVKGDTPRIVEEIQVSKTRISTDDVSEMPSLMGELDVLKSLQAIPGINMHSDGSTFFYVRGGYKDQNLILIDEAPIYNPSHLLGFFSTIIPEAVNDITVYKGDMPVNYGGRLSSVVDIRTKEGNSKKFQASGSIGLISSKLALEGPIKKDKISYFIGGRLSNIKWLSQLANADIDRFYFYDLTGKLNFKINPNNKLYASFYSGEDLFNDGNSGISWKNSTATLRWNHVFNSKLFSNTTLHASQYDYFLHTNLAAGERWVSHIENVTLKSDFTYFVNPDNSYSFGVEIGAYGFNPGNLETPQGGDPFISKKNATEFVAYAGQEVRISPKWGLRYGFRIGNWGTRGEAFEFDFDSNGFPVDTLYYQNGETYLFNPYFEPRFNVSYFFDENRSLKVGFNRNVQNIHLITNSISPFTTLDVWVPTSRNVKAQQAEQVVLGYYQYFPNTGVSFEIETYLKWLHNQIEYDEHANLILNPFYEAALNFGRGKAAGVEAMLRKQNGRLRGWLGYTYSRARLKIPGINQGLWYPAFSDRPHEVTLFLSYDITQRINLGLNWIFYTGPPFTSPTSFYYYDSQEVPIYAEKNNDRLPNYHRLDLSASFQLNKDHGKFQHFLNLAIFNFYGNKNPVFINNNKTLDDKNNVKIPGNLFSAQRIYSQTYLYGFIPSVAYNFKFN